MSTIYIFVCLIVIWFPTRCRCLIAISIPIPPLPNWKPHEAKVKQGHRSWKSIKYYFIEKAKYNRNIKANPCSQLPSMLKSSSSGDESEEFPLLLGPSEL